MDLHPSVVPASSRLRLEEMTVPVAGLAAALAARRVTSNRIVKLSDAPDGVSVSYLAGTWDGHPFRVSFPMRRTDHLRSIIRLSGALTAFEVVLAHPERVRRLLPAVRSLTILETELGDKPEDVYFVSHAPGAACQFVLDATNGAPHLLWAPGRVGVTSVRVNWRQTLLVGVLTDEEGRGSHLVTTSLRDAIRFPARIADPAIWRRLSPDENEPYGIVALSRSETTERSMQFCVMLSRADAARVEPYYAKRAYLQGNLLSSESGVLWDAPYRTPYLVIGRLPRNPSVWVAYWPQGFRSDGSGVEIALRAEVPADPSRPFELLL